MEKYEEEKEPASAPQDVLYDNPPFDLAVQYEKAGERAFRNGIPRSATINKNPSPQQIQMRDAWYRGWDLASLVNKESD